MSFEFGWWATDEDGRRFQVRAEVARDTVTWQRKQGHHQAWQAYGPPTEADWDALVEQAGRRVPRRTISPRQFEEIKRLRDRG